MSSNNKETKLYYWKIQVTTRWNTFVDNIWSLDTFKNQRNVKKIGRYFYLNNAEKDW